MKKCTNQAIKCIFYVFLFTPHCKKGLPPTLSDEFNDFSLYAYLNFITFALRKNH